MERVSIECPRLDFVPGHTEAELMRLVVLTEKNKKAGTLDMARALATLGGSFCINRRVAAAETLLERALALFSILGDPDSDGFQQTRSGLLWTYHTLGHEQKAEELLRCRGSGERYVLA